MPHARRRRRAAPAVACECDATDDDAAGLGPGVRVVHLSDTHGLHEKYSVPRGDVLIHTGDFCRQTGTPKAYGSFNTWLGQLPHPHKLVVLGNHDMLGRWRTEEMAALLPHATHVFDCEEITVCGLRIFGVSYNQSLLCLEVPKGLDVLLSHEPPLGTLDRCVAGQRLGDPALRDQVCAARPRYHLFGHVHEAHGEKRLEWGAVEDCPGAATVCINGSQSDRTTSTLVHPPRVLLVDLLPGRPSPPTVIAEGPSAAGGPLQPEPDVLLE